MTVKLKWEAEPAPTGRFRSFHKRGWPKAVFKDSDKMAAALYCETDYIPRLVKTGEHAPIEIHLAYYNTEPGQGAFKWRRLVVRAKTLDEAKYLVQSFWDRRHSEVGPNCKKVAE